MLSWGRLSLSLARFLKLSRLEEQWVLCKVCDSSKQKSFVFFWCDNNVHQSNIERESNTWEWQRNYNSAPVTEIRTFLGSNSPVLGLFHVQKTMFLGFFSLEFSFFIKSNIFLLVTMTHLCFWHSNNCEWHRYYLYKSERSMYWFYKGVILNF